RILLAVIISFLFFVIYDYFFIPKNNNIIEKNITQNQTANQIQENLAPNVESKNINLDLKSDNQNSIISIVKSSHFEAQIDSLGRIAAFYLKDKKFQDKNNEFINLVSKELAPYPLEIRFSDSTLNQEAFKVAYVADKKELFID
ncbi:membrane protein insertase YidC, partial [Campylobacter novaezeelandiae]|nr:membrane protein insertase YidC [Campylobacter novaezeelandiae]